MNVLQRQSKTARRLTPGQRSHMTTADGVANVQAKKLVASLHRLALQFQRERLVDEAGTRPVNKLNPFVQKHRRLARPVIDEWPDRLRLVHTRLSASTA